MHRYKMSDNYRFDYAWRFVNCSTRNIISDWRNQETWNNKGLTVIEESQDHLVIEREFHSWQNLCSLHDHHQLKKIYKITVVGWNQRCNNKWLTESKMQNKWLTELKMQNKWLTELKIQNKWLTESKIQNKWQTESKMQNKRLEDKK